MTTGPGGRGEYLMRVPVDGPTAIGVPNPTPARRRRPSRGGGRAPPVDGRVRGAAGQWLLVPRASGPGRPGPPALLVIPHDSLFFCISFGHSPDQLVDPHSAGNSTVGKSYRRICSSPQSLISTCPPARAAPLSPPSQGKCKVLSPLDPHSPSSEALID